MDTSVHTYNYVPIRWRSIYTRMHLEFSMNKVLHMYCMYSHTYVYICSSLLYEEVCL